MTRADLRMEKRESERVELAGSITGEVSVVQPTRVTEIGPRGMQVETGFALPLNSIHEFRISLDGTSVVVKGRVAHAHIGDVERDLVTYVSGIELVGVPQHVVDAIERFVAARPRHGGTRDA